MRVLRGGCSAMVLLEPGEGMQIRIKREKSSLTKNTYMLGVGMGSATQSCLKTKEIV